MKCLRCIAKYALVLAVCVASFLLLLTLAFCIPDSAIAGNRTEALAIIEREGVYPNALFYRYASQLDNATDRLILETTEVADASMNAFQAAISMNGYARYWHGAEALLRPALTVLSYVWIRYINMFLLLFLLCAAYSLLQKHLGMRHAIAFLFSMATVCFCIVPASLQFTPVFVLMLLSLILLMLMYGKHPASSFPMLFFITGILTSFFDLLTAPLLTFGMPAVCYVLLENKYNEAASFRANLKKLFWLGLAWLAGYGLCWASKWIIADLALGGGAASDALSTALIRIGGADQTGAKIDHGYMLAANFGALFPGAKSALGIAALLALFAANAVLFREKKAVWARALALLPLALLPYAWYLALGNHSQVHFWFTCRAQAVTVFALLSFLFSCTDFARVKAFLYRFCPAKKKEKAKE